ncbi:MAG: tetratricopeptide repeat protein, partial [Bacteroidota bacterium]
RIGKEKNANKGLRRAYQTSGGMYYFRGDYDKAIAEFYKATEVDSLNNQKGNAQLFGNIGVIYKKQNNLPKATSFQNKALNIFENLKDTLGMAITFLNIGELHRIQSALDSALHYFHLSLDLKQQIGIERGLSINYNNLGLCYSEKGDRARADLYFQKALDIEKKFNNEVRIAETLSDFARHLQLSKDYGKSKMYADSALSMAKRLELKGVEANLYDILAQNHAGTGDFKQAFQYQKSYAEAREAILNEDINARIAEMDAKYELAQKEHQIDRQGLELRAQEADLAKKTWQRNGLALIAILALVAALLFWRAYSQKKRIAKLVAGNNALIEKRNEDLEQINQNVRIELEKLQVVLEDKEQIISNIFEEKRAVALPPELLSLSKREMEVLSYIALGWSDHEIAEKLFVSKSTVKTHVRRVYSKLLVKNRGQAVAIAHKYGILGPSQQIEETKGKASVKS